MFRLSSKNIKYRQIGTISKKLKNILDTVCVNFNQILELKD